MSTDLQGLQEILGFMEGPRILKLDCIVHLEYIHEYFKQLDCTRIQELICGPDSRPSWSPISPAQTPGNSGQEHQEPLVEISCAEGDHSRR